MKSIGYKSVPVDGLPFDLQKGILYTWEVIVNYPKDII